MTTCDGIIPAEQMDREEEQDIAALIVRTIELAITIFTYPPGVSDYLEEFDLILANG